MEGRKKGRSEGKEMRERNEERKRWKEIRREGVEEER